jgi:hypothetical protein
MAAPSEVSGGIKSSSEQEDEIDVDEVPLDLTQCFANDNLRSIVQLMLNAEKESSHFEMALSVKKFLLLYPQVTSAGFSDDGTYQNEYNLVRDARCFFMVYQYNRHTNGIYHTPVKKTHSSFVQCSSRHSIPCFNCYSPLIYLPMYLFPIRIAFGI